MSRETVALKPRSPRRLFVLKAERFSLRDCLGWRSAAETDLEFQDNMIVLVRALENVSSPRASRTVWNKESVTRLSGQPKVTQLTKDP